MAAIGLGVVVAYLAWRNWDLSEAGAFMLPYFFAGVKAREGIDVIAHCPEIGPMLQRIEAAPNYYRDQFRAAGLINSSRTVKSGCRCKH